MPGYPLVKKVVVTRSGVAKVVVNRAKPIYSRAGSADISNGAETVSVTFPTSLKDTNFVFFCQLFNSADNPVNTPFLQIKGYTLSQTGFTVYLSAPVPTANYKLHWSLAEKYNP